MNKIFVDTDFSQDGRALNPQKFFNSRTLVLNGVFKIVYAPSQGDWDQADCSVNCYLIGEEIISPISDFWGQSDKITYYNIKNILEQSDRALVGYIDYIDSI